MKQRYRLEYYDGKEWRRSVVLELEKPPPGPLTSGSLAAVLIKTKPLKGKGGGQGARP